GAHRGLSPLPPAALTSTMGAYPCHQRRSQPAAGQEVTAAREAMNAHSELIVSVSGIRGVVGQALTPAVTLAFASALGEHLGGRSVVVGRDGRPSGLMLRYAALAGLSAAGCEVHDLGVA